MQRRNGTVMAVSKRLRHEVMRRDNHACRYCGGTAPDVKLTIDHVTPVTLGDSDEPSNLVTACADCNAGKSGTPPDAALVADVDQRAVEWGQAMQVAIERRAAELAAERSTTEPFDAAWTRWTVGGQAVYRDANWRNSILRFLAAGLTDQFFVTAIETAMGQDRIPASDKWRYFCGICWREMDTLQGMAREVASERRGDSPQSTTDRRALGHRFDFMSVFDQYARSLVAALGGDTQVERFIVDRCLWDLMPAAHEDAVDKLAAGEADDDVSDASIDYAASYISLPMSEVRKWHEAGGKSPLDIWSSSEDRWQRLDGDLASAYVAIRPVVAALGGDDDVDRIATKAVADYTVRARERFDALCEESPYQSGDGDVALLHRAWTTANVMAAVDLAGICTVPDPASPELQGAARGPE